MVVGTTDRLSHSELLPTIVDFRYLDKYENTPIQITPLLKTGSYECFTLSLRSQTQT